MKHSFLIFLLLLAVLISSCGQDKGGKTDALTGTWNATKREFTNLSSPFQKIDVIQNGTTYLVTFNTDGTYEAQLTPSGLPAETVTGDWDLSLDILTLKQTGQPFSTQFSYTLSGDTLTLTEGDSIYDFNDDGNPLEAHLDMILVRQ